MEIVALPGMGCLTYVVTIDQRHRGNSRCLHHSRRAGARPERAHDAVNFAKTDPYGVAVVGPDPAPSTQAQTGLRSLVRRVPAGRSDSGHAAAGQGCRGAAEQFFIGTLASAYRLLRCPDPHIYYCSCTEI